MTTNLTFDEFFEQYKDYTQVDGVGATPSIADSTLTQQLQLTLFNDINKAAFTDNKPFIKEFKEAWKIDPNVDNSEVEKSIVEHIQMLPDAVVDNIINFGNIINNFNNYNIPLPPAQELEPNRHTSLLSGSSSSAGSDASEINPSPSSRGEFADQYLDIGEVRNPLSGSVMGDAGLQPRHYGVERPPALSRSQFQSPMALAQYPPTLGAHDHIMNSVYSLINKNDDQLNQTLTAYINQDGDRGTNIDSPKLILSIKIITGLLNNLDVAEMDFYTKYTKYIILKESAPSGFWTKMSWTGKKYKHKRRNVDAMQKAAAETGTARRKKYYVRSPKVKKVKNKHSTPIRNTSIRNTSGVSSLGAIDPWDPVGYAATEPMNYPETLIESNEVWGGGTRILSKKKKKISTRNTKKKK